MQCKSLELSRACRWLFKMAGVEDLEEQAEECFLLPIAGKPRTVSFDWDDDQTA